MYKGKVLFHALPIDACYIFLGRTQHDRNVVHDDMINTYQVEKDGKKYKLYPLKSG